MKRLLIVDDEDYIDSMTAACGRRGIKAFRAATGMEALEMVERIKPHVVLIDFHLPDMNGISVYEKIKHLNVEMDVYFISGNPTEAIQHKAEQLGAKGFFIKPVNLMSVVSALIPQEPF